LFIATKADLDLAQQRHEVQPDIYCQKLGLNIPSLSTTNSTGSNNFSGPISISIKYNQTADLYSVICSIALDPRGAIIGENDRSALSYANSRGRFLLYVGVVLLGGSVAVYSIRSISPGLNLSLGKWKESLSGSGNEGGSSWLNWLRSSM